MIVGVPKETFAGERRVAIVPAVVPVLTRVKMEVLVEAGAGQAAGFPDAAYQEKGARIIPQRAELFSKSDLLLQVRTLDAHPEGKRGDLSLLRSGQVVIGLLEPLNNPGGVQDLARTGIMAFAMELMPRISRAQTMDALSSMATVAGYKAVILAAEQLPKMFPLLMTAGGIIHPARVLVIGAGVAGLQAIATAHRLGGVVQAYDVRPAVKEQVESLGAKFVDLPLDTAQAEDARGYARAMDESFYRRQREMMARVVASSDVVITTATIPGKRAPVLIMQEMLAGMEPGSVIVDLAADQGGNCECTRPGETVKVNGVTVMGPLNLSSTVPYHASQMYARNITNFLLHLVREGKVRRDLEDEIIRETLVTGDGQVLHLRVRELLGLGTAADLPAGRQVPRR
jgi:NAD(P) transhydrogenase subunit alpha